MDLKTEKKIKYHKSKISYHKEKIKELEYEKNRIGFKWYDNKK